MICVRCCHLPSTPYSMCHWLLGSPEDEGCLVKVCNRRHKTQEYKILRTVLEESLNSQFREDVLNWDRWEPNETWPSFSQALCVLSIQLKLMKRRTNFRLTKSRRSLEMPTFLKEAKTKKLCFQWRKLLTFEQPPEKSRRYCVSISCLQRQFCWNWSFLFWLNVSGFTLS